jgi:hypothetical protein
VPSIRLYSVCLPLAAVLAGFLFDVGASTWGGGLGGDSQKYFTSQIQSYGVHIAGVYAWEAGYLPADGVTVVDHMSRVRVPAFVSHRTVR